MPKISTQCCENLASTLSKSEKRFVLTTGDSGLITLPVTIFLPLSAGFAVWHEAQATSLPLAVLTLLLKKALPSSAEGPANSLFSAMAWVW